MNIHKQFKLTSKNHYAFYLEYIIIFIAGKMNRFERYVLEMEDILAITLDLPELKQKLDDHSDLNSSPTIEFGLYVDKLPAEIYDSYMDMTTGAGLGIVNLFADTQTDAISYVNFRKLIKKENFASALKPLDARCTTMLDRLRDFRNWAAHVPQSLINAEMVSAEKLDRDAKSKLLQQRTEIKVPIYEVHGTEIFVQLYRDCYLSLKRFRELHSRVCEDYAHLIGKDIKVDYAVFENREYEHESIQDISYSMQRNKFKPM